VSAIVVGAVPYDQRMAKYSARDVAAELRRRHPELPVKKLHKLLYYCQGWHAATMGEPLFSETISAWDMGPVVGQLWYAEKQHGRDDEPANLSEAELNTIGYVLSRYGMLSGRDLEFLTHSETPWAMANAARDPGQSVKIPIEAIAQYFRDHGDEDDDSSEQPLDVGTIESWLKGAERRRGDTLRPDTPDELLALVGGG
jgi:uncharacterized phage-associated protein